MSINILIVDDHAVLRNGIRRLLEQDKELVVIGEVKSGEEAIKWVRSSQPDVILMDIKMPGIGGYEATCRIHKTHPKVKILILTSATKKIYAKRLLKVGALGYVTKNAGIEELIEAIKTVYTGQRYISWDISNQMAYESATKKKDTDSPFDVLSEREMQVVFRIVRGRRAPQIADEHSLSSKTVNSYRYRVFEKLGVRNDVELTLMAVREGLIDVDEDGDEGGGKQ